VPRFPEFSWSYPNRVCENAVPEVLVVTFASAPGVPNWGGVLGKLARESTPEEKCFDILFVCDGGRNWYSGKIIAKQVSLTPTNAVPAGLLGFRAQLVSG
jgi:hypothetical protein